MKISVKLGTRLSNFYHSKLYTLSNKLTEELPEFTTLFSNSVKTVRSSRDFDEE